MSMLWIYLRNCKASQGGGFAAKKLLNVPDPRHYPLRREEILSDEVTKGDEPFIDDFRFFSYETRSSARCNYKLVGCPKCGVVLLADKATKEDLADE